MVLVYRRYSMLIAHNIALFTIHGDTETELRQHFQRNIFRREACVYIVSNLIGSHTHVSSFHMEAAFYLVSSSPNLTDSVRCVLILADAVTYTPI